MNGNNLVFNPPPGWPKPPEGWQPPAGWTPDPNWPKPPDGWQLWLPDDAEAATQQAVDSDESLPVSSGKPDGGEPAPAITDAESRIALLEAENAALRARLEDKGDDVDELVVLDDERVLQSVGIYRYHHPLENAAAYKSRLDDLGKRIAEQVKAGLAIEKSNMFTFDNSLAKGRRMTNDLAKLMLRAYNAEADNSIRSLRIGNVVTAKKRLDASRTA